jgi:tetratricopeptide (TPR) repeat protein
MVGEQARDAVVAAAQLRVAVPRTLLERLASSESIRAAQEAEVIWSKKDDRWQSILSVLGLFRLRAITADDEEDAGVSYEALQISKNEEDVALHNKIAALYRGVYRLDDDPKWIRESFFHQLLANAGSSKDLPSRIGAYYGSELVSSADYYFSKAKDYVGALALYKLAASIVSLNDNAEMRYASCLIRTGDMAEGDKIYSKLISEFDGNIGFKTSYVDALLYRGDFERAKAKLEAFNLRDEKDWVRWQWGRVYGGLDQYDKAIEALKPLIGRPDGDPHFHVHYARALRAFGASDRALEVLKAAALQFPKETAIITAYAVERAEHGEVDAIGTLRELFTANASNTRAALVIIRSYLQDGDIGSAQRVLAEARKSAPASTRSIVEVADAEVIAARGQVDLAIAKLKTGTQDAGTIVSLIELMAVREGLSRSRNSDVISELSKIGILQRLRINAPVQKSILNLADTIGDASLRSEALARLQNTAVTPEELAAL